MRMRTPSNWPCVTRYNLMETMPLSMMKHLEEDVPPVFMILDTYDKDIKVTTPCTVALPPQQNKLRSRGCRTWNVAPAPPKKSYQNTVTNLKLNHCTFGKFSLQQILYSVKLILKKNYKCNFYTWSRRRSQCPAPTENGPIPDGCATQFKTWNQRKKS